MVSIIDFYVLQKRPSKEGFDIVIGNPPYVNFANIKSAEYRTVLKEKFLYLANLHTSFLCNLIYPTFSRILLYSC